MNPNDLESLVRNAFRWNGRCDAYTARQIAWFYENLSLLGDDDINKVVPLLLVCEINNSGTQEAMRDMLIYFLDGARLKLQPNGSWWCNEKIHNAEISYSVGMFDNFSRAQKDAICRWLVDYARDAFKEICPQSVVSAILFWEGGCHPENFEFQSYRRVVQQDVGYMLIPIDQE